MAEKDDLDEKRILFHDVRARLQLLDLAKSLELDGINPIAETRRLDILFSSHARAVEQFLAKDDRQTRLALRDTSAALYHCVKWLIRELERADTKIGSLKDFKIWLDKWSQELPEDER